VITFRPDFIVAQHLGAYDHRQPENLLPLYEHFARATLDLYPGHLECLNNTSSINNSEFESFTCMEKVNATLAKFLSKVAVTGSHRDVLARCGIKTSKDLAKPIRLPGWDRPFQVHYDVRERRLVKSWNDCHPDARFGQYASIQFTTYRRWMFTVNYGYSHDSSSWQLNYCQRKGESLNRFGQKVKAWIDELFEPEPDYSRTRFCANYRFDDTTRAVRKIFYDEYVGLDDELVQSLLGVEGSSLREHRIKLSRSRLNTLRRWIAADVSQPLPGFET